MSPAIANHRSLFVFFRYGLRRFTLMVSESLSSSLPSRISGEMNFVVVSTRIPKCLQNGLAWMTHRVHFLFDRKRFGDTRTRDFDFGIFVSCCLVSFRGYFTLS